MLVFRSNHSTVGSALECLIADYNDVILTTLYLANINIYSNKILSIPDLFGDTKNFSSSLYSRIIEKFNQRKMSIQWQHFWTVFMFPYLICGIKIKIIKETAVQSEFCSIKPDAKCFMRKVSRFTRFCDFKINFLVPILME